MAINVTTLESNLTTKINATTGTTDGKEFLLLSKAVEAINTAVSNTSLTTANNLSDLTDAAAARTNLGLSTSFAALSGATFTGPVTIPNLTVTGTTTTVNSTDLVVADKNITIADGAADAAAANGAGITVDGASANITYTSATDTWDLNKDLIINTTGALIVPDGTTAQRPGSTSAGAIRFNTDDTSFEGYDGTSWAAIGGGGGGVTVGAITTTYDFDNSTNKVSLSSNATFTPSNMAEGKETFLRITTNAYIPKFSDHVYWFDGAAPDWRQYPIWLINLVCVDGSTIIARPMGYSLTAPKAKFVYHETGVYTFVVPNNTTQIIAVAIGGGGSGADLGSGAGGGAAMRTYTVTSGTECQITVGAGGAQQQGTSGNAGGTSSFAISGQTTISATGGGGGGANSESSGGVGTGGTINGTGGKGLAYQNDPEIVYSFAVAHARSSGFSGGAGGGGAPSDNGAAQHGGEGSGFAGGGGGGGSDNGDGGNGGQGGPASAYEWAPGGFGGGGGSTDGTRTDAFPGTRMGGYGGGFGGRDAIAANTNHSIGLHPGALRGGDGGGPNGGIGGEGNPGNQRGGGGGGGSFGGGGGGNRDYGSVAGTNISAGGGGGAVIILCGYPQPYS